MNTDIRIDVGFLDHWKTDSLISECGADGVLALMRLWVFAAQNKPDGRLTGVKDEMIERIAKWRGESGALINILIETRFIEKDEAGIWCLHDWERHNPYAANAEWRHERAKKANAARRTKEASDTCNNPATSPLQARYKPAPPPAPAPAPAPFPFPFPAPAAEPPATAAPPAAVEPDPPKKEKKRGGVLGDAGKPLIPADWQPAAETLEACGSLGISAAFAAQQVPLFRLWHQEAETRRSGFESPFIGWVQKAWKAQGPPTADEPIYHARPKHMTLLEWEDYQRRRYLPPDNEPDPFAAAFSPAPALPEVSYERAH